MSDNTDFFEECTSASEVKQFIVEKYFTIWASIMVNYLKGRGLPLRLAYIDLFAGQGKYDDGTESTPILVVKKILANPTFYNNIMLYFNDMNAEYIGKLKVNLSLIPDIEKLRYKPVFENYTVDKEVVEMFNRSKLPPSLLFIDPCGYDGFSLGLVWSVVKGFGCDCIAFFNYSRINMHLSNRAIPREKLDAILECDSQKLLLELSGLNPIERERKVIDIVKSGALAKGINYTMEFRFKSITNRTSHFLLFFSRSFKGYDEMKQVMYKASVYKDDDGVADYQFAYGKLDEQLTISFESFTTLSDLKRSLLHEYKGKTIEFEALYEEHSVGKRYIIQNYKKVLREMLVQKIISTNRTPKSGFSLDLVITFPKDRNE